MYFLNAHDLEWTQIDEKGGDFKLIKRITEVHTSLIQLQIDAKDVQFVKNVADGEF